MKIALAILLVASTAVAPGCQVVFDDEKATEIPAGPEGDDARNEMRLEETFESVLIPRIEDNAQSIDDLRKELSEGLDTVGAKRGNRGSGMGAAWNFATKDSGAVVAARLDTSARNIDIDIDGNGLGDVNVQLGPVIRGTALRDFAPFYNFDDFRDQIEFAKLARAINDRVKTGLVVPDGDLIGRQVSFTGVTALKNADDTLVVTPIAVEFEQ